MMVPGADDELNQSLEKAGRVADFLELGELMCLDALERDESCGGHFREEYQTPEGEAQAQRREVLLRGGLGVQGRRNAHRSLHKEPLDVRERPPRAAELQVMTTCISSHLAAEECGAPGRWCRTRCRTSTPTCRSWRCWTCSTSG